MDQWMGHYDLLTKIVNFKVNGGKPEDLKRFFRYLSDDDLKYLFTFGSALAKISHHELRSRQMLEDLLASIEERGEGHVR